MYYKNILRHVCLQNKIGETEGEEKEGEDFAKMLQSFGYQRQILQIAARNRLVCLNQSFLINFDFALL